MYKIIELSDSKMKRKDKYGGLFVRIPNTLKNIALKIAKRIYKLQDDFESGKFNNTPDMVMFFVNFHEEATYITLERLHGLKIEVYRFEVEKIKEAFDDICDILNKAQITTEIVIDTNGNQEGLNVVKEVFLRKE